MPKWNLIFVHISGGVKIAKGVELRIEWGNFFFHAYKPYVSDMVD